MGNIVIGVDIGTSSAKGLAVLPDGSVLGTFQKSYPLQIPQPGFVEQDADLIVKTVLELLKEIIDRSGTDQILCISFSSAMHSLIAVDERGKAISPMLTWADTRSSRYAKQLRSITLGQQLYEITGTPIHPMSPLCKLLWMKDEQPKLFKAAAKFVGIKEYLFFQLFGEWVIDHSIASATGLFDIVKLRWSEKALNAVGLETERLSSPVTTVGIFSELKPEKAKAIGLNKQVPFVIGASDGCLANLGSDVMKKGEMAITIGTSGAVRMTVPKVTPDSQGRIFNYILKKDIYIVGGATNNGAAVLKWFEEKFGSGKEDLNLTDTEKVGPGASSLMFLPYLLGERAPIFDPDARGVFFGISLHHDKSHFKRAILEGICHQVLSIVTSMKVYGPVRQIMASGGFSQSSMWVQMLADVLGREIKISGDYDSSTMGAARLGFEAMNVPTKENWIHYDRVYQPDLLKNKFYSGQHQLFQSLYDQLKNQFGQLQTFQ